jgi:hypothetical protein
VNAAAAQGGVLVAGGVLVGVPVYRSIRDSGSLPSAHRVVTPLVVVGGAALLAQVAPVLGVSLAWLAVLGLLLSTQTQAKRKPSSPADSHGGRVQRSAGFGGGGGGAF